MTNITYIRSVGLLGQKLGPSDKGLATHFLFSVQILQWYLFNIKFLIQFEVDW